MILDRSIPYFNCIMRCDHPLLRIEALPQGYEIRPYRDGDGPGWARVEHLVGEFDSYEEALDCFTKYVATHGEAYLARRSFFCVKDGQIVGMAGAMEDDRQDQRVASVHWVAVDPAHQRQGIARALMTRVMNFYVRNHQAPVYLHTQTWSWAALRLYAGMGFAMTKKDSFSHYENHYANAMRTLALRLSPQEMEVLAAESVE